MARRFESAQAFRTSLETRLRSESSRRGVPVATLRTKVLIERLLARLFAREDAPWLLKGGYSFELRYRPRARTTKDIDLSIPAERGGALGAVVEELRRAAEQELGDFFVFELGEPRGELRGPPGGGTRLPVSVRLLGKLYGEFHLDVALGDPEFGTPEELVGEDHLGFAGLPPPRVRCIRKEQQFAEKVHAYTFPWTDRENTRVKDLVDLVVLIERGTLDAPTLRRAIEATFAARRRQPIPLELEPPPPAWEQDYRVLATEAGAAAGDLGSAFTALREFWAALSPS